MLLLETLYVVLLCVNPKCCLMHRCQFSVLNVVRMVNYRHFMLL